MGDMEIVRQFNSEVSLFVVKGFDPVCHVLQSLFCEYWAMRDARLRVSLFVTFFQLSTIYETKPPISKAKVGSITRLGVKAVKVLRDSL